MFDKLKIWADRITVGEQFPAVASFLDSAKEITDIQTGEVRIFGSMDGLKISMYPSGLSIVGSLAKYLYPSNTYTLDRISTAQAIEKLSDALHFHVQNAQVTGLEFGTQFTMRQPVHDYLSKLGDMAHLQRYNFNPNTLYYKSAGRIQQKVFCFYDKGEDAKTKGMILPKGFEQYNLLRYEMRLNGRLSQQLKTPEIKASTLSERIFYKALIRRYQDCYFSISKQNQIKTDIMSEIKTVSDAFEVLVARLLNQSDHDQITAFLNELREAKVFDDRKSYTRLKKKIQDVATKKGITVSDELIKELDDEIKNIGAYV